MEDEQTTPPTEKQTGNQTITTESSIDIFNWANLVDGVKNELDIEIFVFNKNYTPYTLRHDKALETQIRALFLYDIVNDVNMGAGTGLAVHEFERSDGGEDILLRTRLENVGRAETLLHLLETERKDVEEFSEEEHEFKRIKGVLVKFSPKNADSKVTPFYVAKAVQQSNALKGATSWELNRGKLEPFKADVGLKLPNDNQVLIIDGDIFVFNQPKFEKLFQYEYKKQLLADQKVAEIEKAYKLSFPEGVDLQALVRDRKKIVNKLQKLEIGEVSQEKAIEYADEMQLELMSDEQDRIIIMDGNDLDMFVNLINEDYITSAVTGKRYEIKSKKLLGEPDGEAPRG
jgi:hypothetical protein